MNRKIFAIAVLLLVSGVFGCANISLEKDNCFIADPVSYDDIEIHKANCLERKNCKYIPPGSCYCPPGMRCFCGGGEPPKCVPKEIRQSSENGQFG